MIINGKSVPGMFIYATGSEYEKGDFIVYDEKIYICSPKIGTSYLATSETIDLEYFIPYFSGIPATWEDFYNYYENSNSEDGNKIITNYSLSKIFRKLAFGLNSDGIINEYLESIILDEVGYIKVSGGLSKLYKEGNSSINGILDYILTQDITEFNNLSIKVSRSLLKEILPAIEEESDDLKSVILRQYTYLEHENSIKIRVQEIVDHYFGICYYRYVKLSDEEIKTSSWKPSCINKEYLKKLSALLKYTVDTSSNNASESKFFFKQLDFKIKETGGNIKTYSINSDESVDLSITTVTLFMKKESSELLNSYSITVNLNTSNVTYAFSNNNITLSKKGDVLEVVNSDPTVATFYIDSIFAKSKTS